MDAIKDLDLSYLEKRLMREVHWTQSEAQEAVRAYKNFLILIYKYPKAGVVPTSEIDEVWHAHILHTKEYTRDCHAIFGRYVHHAPFQEHENVSARNKMKDLLARTHVLYAKEFQEPYGFHISAEVLFK